MNRGKSIRQDLQFSMMKLDNKYLRKQTTLKEKDRVQGHATFVDLRFSLKNSVR